MLVRWVAEPALRGNLGDVRKVSVGGCCAESVTHDKGIGHVRPVPPQVVLPAWRTPGPLPLAHHTSRCPPSHRREQGSFDVTALRDPIRGSGSASRSIGGPRSEVGQEYEASPQDGDRHHSVAVVTAYVTDEPVDDRCEFLRRDQELWWSGWRRLTRHRGVSPEKRGV